MLNDDDICNVSARLKLAGIVKSHHANGAGNPQKDEIEGETLGQVPAVSAWHGKGLLRLEPFQPLD